MILQEARYSLLFSSVVHAQHSEFQCHSKPRNRLNKGFQMILLVKTNGFASLFTLNFWKIK